MTPEHHDTRVTLTTAPRPGAVAVLQLHGPNIQRVLQQLTGIDRWTPGRVRLANFAGIDRGLATLLQLGDRRWAQLTPHGGPRVVQKLLEKLAELGVAVQSDPDPLAIYPEADSPIQADALACVARAASPAAIDLLLAQPALWRRAMSLPKALDAELILSHTKVLGRLIDPPSVVVVGRPNVGKSTLMNQMLGRSASVVADLPGTTRDWVGAVVEISDGGWRMADGGWWMGQASNPSPIHHPKSQIPNPPSPIAVRWLDTPGLHASDDGIEQRAIATAQEVIASADVLVAMRDPQQDWPATADLPRVPDIKVVNKADQSDKTWSDAISISAATGMGIDMLQQRVIETLGLGSIQPDAPWAFSDTLRRFMRGEINGLSDYLG